MRPAVIRIRYEGSAWRISTLRGAMARVFGADEFVVAGFSLAEAIEQHRDVLRHLRAGFYWVECLSFGLWMAGCLEDHRRWREEKP